MSHNIHHEHLIKELRNELEPVLTNSPEGIYVYLDDLHKICNQKFADMLGYESIGEWEKNEFPVEDVAEEDRDKIINAYGEASEKFVSSVQNVSCVRKDGKKINARVIMVPVSFKNEIFVFHYITEND